MTLPRPDGSLQTERLPPALRSGLSPVERQSLDARMGIMAQHHFDRACQLIAQSPGLADFHGGQSDDTIRRAQEILGAPFPRSYISFLRNFGCGQIVYHELYGLVDETYLGEGAPNVVWVTLEGRRLGLPPTYVVVEDAGYGPFYCLETSRMNDEGECPVIFYFPQSLAKPEQIASDFGEFFLECVHEALRDSETGR